MADISVRIESNRFLYNHSESGGAIYLQNTESSLIRNNILSYNGAEVFGGGMYVQGGRTAIVNNLISHNTCPSELDYISANGGGIYIISANATLVNNTIADNSYYGVYCGASTVNLINTILYNNFATHVRPSGNDIYYLSDTTNLCISESDVSLENCIITGGIATTSSPGVEPQIRQMTDCFFEDPHFLDTEHNDYQTDFNSVAHNHGKTDTTALWLPEIDEEGNARIIDDIVDIGCYEFPGHIHNRIPHISKIPDYIINTNDTIFLAVNFADPDVSDTHIVTIHSDTSTITIQNISGNIPGSTFMVVPEEGWNGIGEITLKVEDNSGAYNAADSIHFRVTVANSYLGRASIENDEVWSNDTILISSFVYVEKGVTLIIDPDCHILFEKGKSLNIKGRLLAIGDSAHSIAFDIKNHTGSDRWAGIKLDYRNNNLDWPTDSFSILKYCTIQNAENGIYLVNTNDIHIQYCDIHDNGRGIFCNGGATVEHCLIHHNMNATNGGGITANGGGDYHRAKFYNNRIFNNTSESGGGIFIENQACLGGNLIYNNIAFNGGGIYLTTNTLPVSIINNTIVGNVAKNGGGIWAGGGGVSINNIFQYNMASENGNEVYSYSTVSPISIYHSWIQGGVNSFYPKGEIYGDFKFILSDHSEFEDTTNHKYTLKPTSLCINSGLSDTLILRSYDEDILQKIPVTDNHMDIGAVQFNGIPENRLPVIDGKNIMYIRKDTVSKIRINYFEPKTDDHDSVIVKIDPPNLQVGKLELFQDSVTFDLKPDGQQEGSVQMIVNILDKADSIGLTNSDTFRL